jgi:tRNA (guanine37-N1)-methyltransferase
MLNMALVTLFPEMFKALGVGITGRAQEQQLINLQYYNPRDFTEDKYHKVDDRPYGGGPGMVMLVQPLQDAIAKAKADLGETSTVIYLSPQGEKFNHHLAMNLANMNNLIFLCGRYEGIDERAIALQVDRQLSIGDFVISGGELAAMVVIDAITRLLPHALGHERSAIEDSFVAGLLDHPHFTRPEMFANLKVPEVLLSGDHAAIARWRLQQALGRTWLYRQDLLTKLELSAEQQRLLQEFIAEYGVKHE